MSQYFLFIFLIWISISVSDSARHENEDVVYHDPNEVMLDPRRRHAKQKEDKPKEEERKEEESDDEVEVKDNSMEGGMDATRAAMAPQDDNERKSFRRKHGHGHKHALRVKNQYNMAYTDEPGTALRIRGGNVSDTANFPYMAAVILGGRLWCAGAIVDVNWVITAAHCLNYVLNVSPLKTLSKFVKVRVGSMHAHDGGALVGVTGAVRHPKFEEEPVPHADVALLKLEANLEFSKTVNLLRIYDGMKEPYAQSFIVVSGWGVTKATETSFKDDTPDLLYGRLKVRTKHYCEDAYQLVNGFQFTDDFFCASLRNGTRDACLFDAGAPAVQNNRLMGIMSFGPERCGHEFQPAVFIKAFYFKDFVADTINKYKSPIDLIKAMEENDPSLAGAIDAGYLTTLGIGGDPRLLVNEHRLAHAAPQNLDHGGASSDMFTKPDELHD